MRTFVRGMETGDWLMTTVVFCSLQVGFPFVGWKTWVCSSSIVVVCHAPWYLFSLMSFFSAVKPEVQLMNVSLAAGVSDDGEFVFRKVVVMSQLGSTVGAEGVRQYAHSEAIGE